VLALSTYLPLAATLAAEKSAANADMPIFMAHGAADPLIPLAHADASRRALEREGYAVDWRVYPMAHAVCLAEIEAIGAWLDGLARR
jgi:phospholipase/carboxylesterase